VWDPRAAVIDPVALKPVGPRESLAVGATVGAADGVLAVAAPAGAVIC